MPDTYADFCREPSKPHQCMHYSDEDGIRCRAIAMHNEHMCYHHRPDTILPVIENEPFLLDTLDTRADIQRALGQVARQLACNRMDFERARLLMQAITAAMRNLPPHPRPRAAAPQPTHTSLIPAESTPTPTEAGCPQPALSEAEEFDAVDHGVYPSNEAVLLREEPTQNNGVVIPSEVPSPQSKDTDTANFSAPGQPATDNLQPATLSTLQAVAAPPNNLFVSSWRPLRPGGKIDLGNRTSRPAIWGGVVNLRCNWRPVCTVGSGTFGRSGTF